MHTNLRKSLMSLFDVNRIALLALSALLAAPIAAEAADTWTFNSTAGTLTCGSVVLQNVTASGTKLTIGSNASNATATNVNLSLPVYDASATPDVIDTLGQGAFYKSTIITNIVLGEGLRVLKQGVFEGASNLKGTMHIPSTV